jgi:hypothetical protein
MLGHLRTPFYTRITTGIAMERHSKREWLEPEESLELQSQMRTPSYTGSYRCGGIDVLFVTKEGIARGSLCSVYGASRAIGNVFRDSEIALAQRMKPFRCASVACASIGNIPLPKFRSAAEAEAFTADFCNPANAYLYRTEAARLEASRSADSTAATTCMTGTAQNFVDPGPDAATISRPTTAS